MKHHADSELIRLIRASDPGAFEELHSRFWHVLYGIAYKKIGDMEDTGDLLQEMFIELWEKRETLQFSNSVSNWLRNRLWYKIAIYFRYKGFRQKHQESFLRFLKSEEESAVSPDSMELKESDDLMQEILTAISACIEDMPERMKEIYLLSKAKDHSVKEIAEKLGISTHTVKKQLERAATRLGEATHIYNTARLEMLILLWLLTDC